MSLDLAVISLIVFFAFLGAMTGAARQVAHWVALILAYVLARPLGLLLAPSLERTIKGPKVVSVVVATVIVFILVMVVMRFVLTRILQRVLAGKAEQRVSVDRFLGFLLGGGKIAAMAYVLLSALVYMQQHVSVSGRHVTFLAPDSYCFKLAKDYNLFELTQFAAVRDLTQVVQALQDPARAQKIAAELKALQKDVRFREILANAPLRRALNGADYPTVLRNDSVLDLVQDSAVAERLKQAARALSGTPPSR